MSRFKESSLPLSVVAASAAGTAIILATGDRNDNTNLQNINQPNNQNAARQVNESNNPEIDVQIDPRLSETIILQKINSEFAKTVRFMSTYPNEEVRSV